MQEHLSDVQFDYQKKQSSLFLGSKSLSSSKKQELIERYTINPERSFNEALRHGNKLISHELSYNSAQRCQSEPDQYHGSQQNYLSNLLQMNENYRTEGKNQVISCDYSKTGLKQY